MLKSTELSLRAIELAKEVNDLPEVRLADDHANLDDYTAYLRQDAEKSKELALLKDEIIVATRQESDDAQIAMAKNVNMDGLTKEQRDYRDMAQRTSLGNYVLAAAQGREIRDGAEFEYNTEILGTFAIGDYPLEMLLDRDEVIDLSSGQLEQLRYPVASEEFRTEVSGVANTHGNLTFVDRIFADSEGAYLRASYPAVGPGRHSYPIVSGTGEIGTVIARGTAENPAGGITVTDADPERIQASFEVAAVDELVMPGITNYLGGDIRNALMEGLDNKVVDDLVSASGAANDIGNAVMTLALFLSGMASAVNGRTARTFNEIRILAGNTDAGSQTTFYERLTGLLAGNINDGVFSIIANVRASAHMAAAAGGHDEAFFVRMGPSQPRLIVPVWRRGRLERDRGRLQLQDAITLTGVMVCRRDPG